MELKIVPADEKRKLSVKETLESAIQQDFEGVIVFGIKDGGSVHVRLSDGIKKLEAIGALEVSKMEIWWGHPIHE